MHRYLSEMRCRLHMAQMMPLPVPFTVSCISKILIGFTFLVSAHPDNPGQRAVKWVLLLFTYGHCAMHTSVCLLFAQWLSKKPHFGMWRPGSGAYDPQI